MPVTYNSKKIIPAPFVGITKNENRAGDGSLVGKTYQLTVRGTLLAFKGSPSSSGTFWTISGYPTDETVVADSRLTSILRKQEALRQLFSEDGKSFEIQALDGAQPLKCNPRVVSVDVAEGVWYDRCDYTIQLEADKIYPEIDASLDSSNIYIESASESWSIETNEDNLETYNGSRTYSLRHNISAKGKRFYETTGLLSKNAWEQARDYVIPRLGFDATIALSSGVNNLPSYYNGINLVRSEEIDELDGSYSVSENWILASGLATEHFSIRIDNSLESPYQTVSLEGEIQGFEQRDSSMNIVSSKWDNALSKFTYASGVAHNRAQTFSGLSLNVLPLTFNQGRNPITGNINYQIDYNDRPSRLIPGAKSEVVSINDNNRGDVFAAIFCIGRSAGPILQDMGATTEASRTLNIELLISPPTYSNNNISTIKTLINQNPRLDPSYSGAIDNIIVAANPINNGFTTSLRSSPQESWDFLNGRYSYNVTWTYE